MEEREDNAIYKVVVNHEEQYSIWPARTEQFLEVGGISIFECQIEVATGTA